MFKGLFGKKKILKIENSNKIKAQLERAQKYANNRKKQIRKNQANSFIRKKQKEIEAYKAAELNSFIKKLNNSLSNNNKEEILKQHRNKIKEKLVKREEYLLEKTQNSSISANRLNQMKYQEQKMNINKNYILTKLESNNYNLLYRLINGLFDSKLSDKSKEKFEEYLIQNPSKKEDIMKILKSVYRLKLNKSIENKKVNIIRKLNSGIENKNKIQLLAEIKDISSHINLATSFHNFSKKTYYICNANQLKTNYKVDSVDKLSEKKIDELSPLYYVNGICCLNPLIRKYMNEAKGLKEGLKKEISKNQSSNNGIELVEAKQYNNNNNFIDIDQMIDNIEKYNNKNSILSKFFDKHILGIANEYGIHENNKKNKLSENNNKNKLSEINSKNFDRFCDECQSKIDTIVVVENGKITFIHTKTKKSDGVKIFQKYLQKKNISRNNIQVGGVTVIFEIAGLISICIAFFSSLYSCYDSNSNNVNIKVYMYCCVISLFVSTILIIVTLIVTAATGGFAMPVVYGIAGMGIVMGKGVRELLTSNKKISEVFPSLDNVINQGKDVTSNILLQRTRKKSN